jgi:arylsulfatase A-like enzyme
VWLWATAALAGCSGCGADDPEAPAEVSEAESGVRQAVSIIDSLALCDVDHRGLLIDMGTPAEDGRYGTTLEPPEGLSPTEHGGATWSRVFERKLSLSFYLPQVTPLFVAARAIGSDATRIGVTLDGQAFGTLRIGRDETIVASTRATDLPVDAGLHVLTLYFRGTRKSDTEPYAEIDWIRLGVPDDLERTYGAPTMNDLVFPAAELAGVPHRALSMRAPGSVRCTLRVPPQAHLRAAVGMRGHGSGSATMLVREDGGEPIALNRTEVKGGEAAVWTDVEVSLEPFAGKIITLELGAAETTGTGRLLIGDPVIEVPAQKEIVPNPARSVVLVVLDGVERDDLPPWRETKTPHLPTLTSFARDATVFHGHRAPSTLVAASMASLLSGLSPRSHGLLDSGARLPQSIATVGAIARDGSVRAALFTGVPTTFEPFGFSAAWDRFTQYPPNEGRLASAPLDDAADWLTDPKATEEGQRLLAVIHARGGHPPWEVTPTEADKLPPAEYAGYLSPRRAAQIIAKAQGKHGRLSDGDRERMAALFHTGLSRQDAALGKLIARIKDAGQWESTLFIVTADVASGRERLFADGGELDEEALSIPLYVRFPASEHAGVVVDTPTEVYDVLRTTLASLGLTPPKDLLGEDLRAVVRGHTADAQRLRVAFTDERYSARWGDFALIGSLDKSPSLCVLSLDPSCSYDRTAQHPAVAHAIFRRLAADIAKTKAPQREPLVLNAEQAGWLNIWGAY